MRMITPEQAANHPARSMLTRSLGADLLVQVDMVKETVAQGRHLRAVLRRPVGRGRPDRHRRGGGRHRDGRRADAGGGRRAPGGHRDQPGDH